jgi:ABC-type uncharacterized transport system substrate-binding protein
VNEFSKSYYVDIDYIQDNGWYFVMSKQSHDKAEKVSIYFKTPDQAKEEALIHYLEVINEHK